MRAFFPDDQYPGACDNTLVVAERATVELEFGRILLPQFTVPAGATERRYLAHLVFDGRPAPLRRPSARDVVETDRLRTRASSSTWVSPPTS